MGVVRVTLPILNSGASSDISGTAEGRVIIFCPQYVDNIISKLMDNKPPIRGAWSGSSDPFSILTPAIISVMAEARVARFCMQVEYTKC